MRQKSINRFRGKLLQCQRCPNKYRDAGEVDKIEYEDGSRLELEFIPCCPRCFKKILKTEVKRQFLLDAMSNGLLTDEEYQLYKKKKFSEQDLNNIIRKRKKDKKK